MDSIWYVVDLLIGKILRREFFEELSLHWSIPLSHEVFWKWERSDTSKCISREELTRFERGEILFGKLDTSIGKSYDTENTDREYDEGLFTPFLKYKKWGKSHSPEESHTTSCRPDTTEYDYTHEKVEDPRIFLSQPQKYEAKRYDKKGSKMIVLTDRRHRPPLEYHTSEQALSKYSILLTEGYKWERDSGSYEESRYMSIGYTSDICIEGEYHYQEIRQNTHIPLEWAEECIGEIRRDMIIPNSGKYEIPKDAYHAKNLSSRQVMPSSEDTREK